MPDVKLAFLGYRKPWELDWMTERASSAVEVHALPMDPVDTLEERGEKFVSEVDVLVAWGYNLTGLLSHPGKLKLVQTLAAGTDGVPKTALNELGILVAGNGGANSIAVAEVTVMLIVAALRKLSFVLTNLHSGRYNGPSFEAWEQFPELTEKRVGIVGLGRIGSDVARRLAGWGCDIVYHDKRVADPRHEAECGVRYISLEELMRTSDVVSLHTPLTHKTRGFIGLEQIALMKPTAILVNTGRGPVVDEAALIEALQSGAIAGAGLDVTDVEPIAPDNPLLQMENVVITPHLAGVSHEARKKALTHAIENANRLAAGKELVGLVDPSD